MPLANHRKFSGSQRDLRPKTRAATVSYVSLPAQSSPKDVPPRVAPVCTIIFIVHRGHRAHPGRDGAHRHVRHRAAAAYRQGGQRYVADLPAYARSLFVDHVLRAPFFMKCASAGSLADFAAAGLGRGACLVTGWAYFAAMAFGAAGTAPSSAYYADCSTVRLPARPHLFSRRGHHHDRGNCCVGYRAPRHQALHRSDAGDRGSARSR